jgi:NAD-dependent deacetylase
MKAGGEAEFLALVGAARRMVAFTGAGLSTESGVPDFRSPGSPWMVNKPIPFDAYIASAEVRREAWRRKFTMDDHYRGAQPSTGHRALARLVREGRMQAIITQNIDGLHQAAGLDDEAVIEIHGNGTYATCLDCSTRHEIAEIRTHFEDRGHAPACRACGGIVKSATISFGQRMPESAMRRGACAGLRSLPRRRLLAGGLSGGEPAACRQAGRRAACDRQPRADTARRCRRSGHPW